MDKHAAELRRFYAAVRDGTPAAGSWDESFVDQWLGMLRLPPFETMFPLEPKQVSCSKCRLDPGAMPSRRTECVFSGGALMRCDTCGHRWLEPE